jgi:hypothetical protein
LRYLSRFLAVLALGALLVLTPGRGHASSTLHVPDDYPTIQSAIDAAAAGDIVLVSAGLHVGPIDFNGKPITVASEDGPTATGIVWSTGGVVDFRSGEGRDSVLTGFTISAGYHNLSGGGVEIWNSSPSLLGNHIVGNAACTGAGIFVFRGSPLIEGNLIAYNVSLCSSGAAGGGIEVIGADTLEIRNNVIENNSGVDWGGGIAIAATGSSVIEGNLIRNNHASVDGGGIYMPNESDVLVRQNIISGNHAVRGGGIYFHVFQNRRGPYIVNNTIVDNDAIAGSGVFANGTDRNSVLTNNLIVETDGQNALYCGEFARSAPQISHNDVYSAGGAGYHGICPDQTGLNGNIASPPNFKDSLHQDYRLARDSPAIDAGDNGAPDMPATDFLGHVRVRDGDSDGVAAVDIGAYESAGCWRGRRCGGTRP